MVSNAFSVLSGVSASEVIREVVADEKGYFYVLSKYKIIVSCSISILDARKNVTSN